MCEKIYRYCVMQIQMLREQVNQEVKRRQMYVLRSSRVGREAQQLRQVPHILYNGSFKVRWLTCDVTTCIMNNVFENHSNLTDHKMTTKGIGANICSHQLMPIYMVWSYLHLFLGNTSCGNVQFYTNIKNDICQVLGDSLSRVSQDPSLDAGLLEHETRKLDTSVTPLALPPPRPHTPHTPHNQPTYPIQVSAN